MREGLRAEILGKEFGVRAAGEDSALEYGNGGNGPGSEERNPPLFPEWLRGSEGLLGDEK